MYKIDALVISYRVCINIFQVLFYNDILFALSHIGLVYLYECTSGMTRVPIQYITSRWHDVYRSAKTNKHEINLHDLLDK